MTAHETLTFPGVAQPRVDLVSTRDTTSAPSPWILHPAIDLMFCCGGLVWLLASLHLLLGWSVSQEGALVGAASGSLLSVLGVLLLSDTHNAATLVRLYGDRGMRTNLRWIAYGAPVGLAAIAAASMFYQPLLGAVLLVYSVLIAQHFTAQTYGITLVYCGKRGYKMNASERKTVQLVLQCTMVFAIVRQFADPRFHNSTALGVPLPSVGMLPQWLLYVSGAAVMCAVVAFTYMVVRKALTERVCFPPPALLLVATGVLVFTVSRDMFGVLWIYVPAFFHGAQYLVVTTSCQLKELCQERNLAVNKAAGLLLSRDSLEYWGLLFFMGLALYVGLPALLTKLGIPFFIAFAAVFSAVNLHHFLADHAIWRMKDPKVRQILVA